MPFHLFKSELMERRPSNVFPLKPVKRSKVASKNCIGLSIVMDSLFGKCSMILIRKRAVLLWQSSLSF
jgi:hypothetical protein